MAKVLFPTTRVKDGHVVKHVERWLLEVWRGVSRHDEPPFVLVKLNREGVGYVNGHLGTVQKV